MLAELLVVFGETLAGGAEVEYLPFVWEPPVSFPATLRDIAGRLPKTTDARDADLVTYAHEGSHFLSKGRDGWHGIYIGQGLRLYVPVPPVSTDELFSVVPVEERGSIYETYRQQGATEYWRLRPTMVLDEWVAYTHGSMARQELRLEIRQETDRHCATMATYSWHLLRLARREPAFPINELRDFCRWNDDRCRRFIPDWRRLFTKTFD